MTEQKDPIVEKFEAIFKPAVDFLLPHLMQPNNPLQDKSKMEHEIMDFLMGNDVQKYLDDGFSAISREMGKICSAEERQAVEKEWVNSPEYFSNLVSKILTDYEEKTKTHDPTNVDIPNLAAFPLKSLLGISDKTLDIFYKCGCHLFKEEHYKDAYNAFFIIGYLDNRRVNAWISMGLSAKRDHDIQRAIRAFETATVANPSIALSQLYAAQCYKELKDDTKALEALDLAKDIAETFPERNTPDILNSIKDHINQYKAK